MISEKMLTFFLWSMSMTSYPFCSVFHHCYNTLCAPYNPFYPNFLTQDLQGLKRFRVNVTIRSHILLKNVASKKPRGKNQQLPYGLPNSLHVYLVLIFKRPSIVITLPLSRFCLDNTKIKAFSVLIETCFRMTFSDSLLWSTHSILLLISVS